VGATVSWRLTVGASGCPGTHQCYGSSTDLPYHTFILSASQACGHLACSIAATPLFQWAAPGCSNEYKEWYAQKSNSDSDSDPSVQYHPPSEDKQRIILWPPSTWVWPNAPDSAPATTSTTPWLSGFHCGLPGWVSLAAEHPSLAARSRLRSTDGQPYSGHRSSSQPASLWPSSDHAPRAHHRSLPHRSRRG
jgi:hypothetical protein